MASAEAKYHHEKTGLPVVFFSRATNTVYWDEVFENNPRVVKDPQPGQKVVVVENHPGKRPYILKALPHKYVYNSAFRNEPGELWLTEEEKAKCLPGAVVVEPHTKQELGFSRNKAWPWERWQALVKSLDVPWLQMGPAGTKRLDGVTFIETPRFRDALGYVNSSSLVVCTDSGLHHAAAALGAKAVVLWGGASDPKVAGYPQHVNLRDSDTCGSVMDCQHCKEAMNRITVEMVRNAVQRVLDGSTQEGRGTKALAGR